MFPRISDLLFYLFGVKVQLPFQTYGFFLSLAFLLGAMVLRHELKRMEEEGKLTARVHRFKNNKENIIHPYQQTWGILFVAIVAAFIGSKLFDVFDNFSQFIKSPSIVLFSSQGFSFYGGLILTVISLILYVKLIGLNWKYVIDCTVPSILVGYAMGRLGCHLSGDGCWGVVNTLPQPHWLNWLPDSIWAFRFPHNVINQGIVIPGCGGHYCMVLAQPVYPTSLYEALLSLLSFSLLWFFRKKIQQPVVLFGIFLVLFSTARLFIEQIRVHNSYSLLGWQVSQAEILSATLILTGISAILYYSGKHY